MKTQKKCKDPSCNNPVGPHGAKGMCSLHYSRDRRKRRGEKRTCSQCGESKIFYGNDNICQACRWWAKNHNGKKRVGPIRVRDGLASAHPIEYRALNGARGRCYNKNNKKYLHYGGRGIRVCDRWMGPHGFHNFYKDMGDRPKGTSLDRVDVNGDYSPENCRWASARTQQENQRPRRMYSERHGVTYNKSLKLWVAVLHVKGVRHCKCTKTEEEAIAAREHLEAKFLN